MKNFYNFLIICFIFFSCVSSNSKRDVVVSTIDFLPDNKGFIQYYTNELDNLSTGKNIFSDNINSKYIYEIECKKISGNKYQGYGLIFASENYDNKYYILIDVNCKYLIVKENDPNQNRTIIKDWTLFERLNSGYDVINTIKVIKDSTIFTVFLNDIQVYQFEDDTIDGDRLGYRVSISNDELFPNVPVDVRFRQKQIN